MKWHCPIHGYKLEPHPKYPDDYFHCSHYECDDKAWEVEEAAQADLYVDTVITFRLRKLLLIIER